PGIGRSVAFDVMLIGGVSTLLFNGNPLLRFDGYFILSDWLEIPNLATRASTYLQFVFQKWVLWIDDLPPPQIAPGEPKWLIAYAIGSWIYRLLVSFGIAAFLATKFFVFGVFLALWSLGSVILMPLFNGLRYLITNPRLLGHKRRVYTIAGTLTAVVAIGLFIAPLPYATQANGVVVYPDRAELRARTAGFLRTIEATPGETVAAGQNLVLFEDPTLEAQIAVLSAELEEAQARLSAVQDLDRVQAQMFASQVEHLKDRLATYEERKHGLTASSERSGRFLIARPDDLPGRYFRRGELIGYVIGDDDPVIQMLVPQADIDLIRDSGVSVQVRLADNIEHAIPARIRREVPAAQVDIPNIGLTTRGGGDITIDPSHTQKPEALFRYFLVEVEPLERTQLRFLGAHASVRFSLAGEPVAYRVIRAARQFFIGQFRV
ncbi:MAG: peptidase M50, partial [Ancalomicrobiaceae bacterium]|nr:peptidase M50 [Ancalomicrobiaceae bacterium]